MFCHYSFFIEISLSLSLSLSLPSLSLPPSFSSPVLWLHTLFTLLYLAIAGAFMIHFSVQLGKNQLDRVSHHLLHTITLPIVTFNYTSIFFFFSQSNHTVMVEWIPTYVHREDILNHLQLSRLPILVYMYMYMYFEPSYSVGQLYVICYIVPIVIR